MSRIAFIFGASLHLLHRRVALVHQREEKDADGERDEEDRDAVVADPAVRALQQPEERPGEDPVPAEVDRLLEAQVRALEDLDVLG
ncbi:MAG TPA: hypothetical protein VIZ58_13525, partial [Thermoanaerobaculia bacterium]